VLQLPLVVGFELHGADEARVGWRNITLAAEGGDHLKSAALAGKSIPLARTWTPPISVERRWIVPIEQFSLPAIPSMIRPSRRRTSIIRQW